jgi:hypothetical protein
MGEAQSRQPVATPAAQTLEAELDRIAALDLDEVRALWREMTQQNAPQALSRDLLARTAKASGDWTLVTRDDGSSQWAYKGTKPGDVTGDGFLNGAWHIAKP